MRKSVPSINDSKCEICQLKCEICPLLAAAKKTIQIDLAFQLNMVTISKHQLFEVKKYNLN